MKPKFLGKKNATFKSPSESILDAINRESSKEMLDTEARDSIYAFILKINMKDAIIDYKTIMNIWNKWYVKSVERS